jgi:protocatechuate 3,4-dioxygenase beta subunit
MKAGWLAAMWLSGAGAGLAFQTATTTSTGAIEGQVFSVSTGGPLKKVSVRLTGGAQGGRGAVMGQGQAQGARGGQTGGAAQGQAAGGARGAQPTATGQTGTAQTGQAQTVGGAVAGAGGVGPSNFTRETDEAGRFSFTGLPAGRYQLSAERQGYLRQAYGARKYNTSGTPIILKEDQKMRDVVIRMNPQSVIVGKVVDEDGDPMEGIEVRAMKSAYRNGKKQWVTANSGETNDVGVYRIPALDPGQYVVSTVALNPQRGGPGGPGGRGGTQQPLPETPESIYAATYFPNAQDSMAAVPVDLAAGSELSGIDIRLRKTRVFRVRGKVANVPAATATASAAGGGGGRGGMGGPGMGMGGSVMVTLVPQDGARPGGPGSAARAPDYAFEIRGISPGSYTLIATTGNPGGGPGGPGGRAGGSTGGQTGMMAVQQVHVGNNHLEGLVLNLSAGAEIQGTVKIEDTSAPPAVSNLNIALRPSIQSGGAPRVKVADDLSFTLSGVSPLPAAVNVTGIPDGCYVKSIRFGGQEVPDDGISMASGGIMQVILSATAGTITATIADKDGNPVQGATVALYQKDAPVASAKSASSNESGTASFKGLKPADYLVIAWEDIPSGAYLDPLFVKPYESRGETVKVGASSQQAVQVKVIPAEETDK